MRPATEKRDARHHQLELTWKLNEAVRLTHDRQKWKQWVTLHYIMNFILPRGSQHKKNYLAYNRNMHS